MKKIKFVLNSRYVGGTKLEEVFEFDDSYSDKYIDIDFQMWVEENTTQDTYWEEVED